MEEGSISETFPELKDLELKIGRKMPDGLLKWMRDDAALHLEDGKLSLPHSKDQDPRKKDLGDKIRDLKIDMGLLRSADVKILRQLLTLHEGIESLKWLVEERGTLTSHCSSLTGSQYSLAEGPDASLRDSWSSLHDPNDRLDNISIGSYLDTLADDLDEYCPSGSESTHCPAPLGTELCGQTGAGSGKVERAKVEASVWTRPPSEISKATEPGRVTPGAKEAGQAQVGENHGLPEKNVQHGANQESACASLAEKRTQSQSPKVKPYKNGKVDLEAKMLNGLNGRMNLEYDAHWHWVQSQDDVTFL
ncbi:leucine rich adaptor protein 1 [Brienomyrus brachyistius]|uniref:leucine rich adaptor protein 1 n=1 Tax=Brienomyrus brachyistius TaxID=42636 RepID=UPI0020B1A37C|nr:leucine rich adaptor protein 1 [Brienomyrus brachyistius]